MSAAYHMPPLERRHRTVFFYLLLFIFLCVMPLLILYANGYRFQLFSEEPVLVLTGALYIATQVDDSQIFVDDKPVQNTRFFRRATYVQGLLPGIHQVHVQGEGLQTWVKNLPVYEQMVTEVAAFTIPEIPQVRPITSYRSLDGQPVFLGYESVVELPFAFASSTVSVTYSPQIATSSWEKNPEFTFLTERFTELDRPAWPVEELPRFRFATTSPQLGIATTATSTVLQNNIALLRRGDEVVAEYRGTLRSIPYYFCVPSAPLAQIASHYGQHVADALGVDPAAATTTLFERGSWFGQTCRSEIRLDRKGQTVHWFDFVPGSRDLVLLQLDTGLYVTEIDDRSWQNHQLLYPNPDITVIVEGGQVIVQDGDYFAELSLELGS